MAEPSPESTAPGPEPDGSQGQEPDPLRNMKAGDLLDDDGQEPPKEGRTYPEAYVRQLRRETAGYRTRLAEVETRLQEVDDREKTETEKLTTRLADSERRATEAEGRLIRYEVASEHGLDMNAANFLTGNTREEVEASAEALAVLLKERSPGVLPSFDGGSREPVPEPGKAPAEAHNDFLLRALGRKPS